MMNFLKSFIILLILITVTNAKHEGTFNVNNIDRLGDYFEIDTLSVKYSLDFLMGEIVLRANAKYTIGNYITIDGNVHKINEFPAEVQDKLRLTELKVEVGVVSDAGVPNMYVQMDLGAMGKPNEWSYNTGGSPDWNKFIYDGGSNYLGKEQTIKVMKQFRRFGLGEHLSSARTIAIGYDVSAARNYILKQKQDEEKKQKEKQDEVEKSLTESKKTPSLMMDILDEMGSEKYNQKSYKTKTETIDQPTKTLVDIKVPSINEKNPIGLNQTKIVSLPKSKKVKKYNGKKWTCDLPIGFLGKDYPHYIKNSPKQNGHCMQAWYTACQRMVHNKRDAHKYSSSKNKQIIRNYNNGIKQACSYMDEGFKEKCPPCFY